MFLQRINVFPRSIDQGEARSLMEERVRTSPSRGVRSNLSRLLLPYDGPAYTVGILHENLESYEKLQDNNTTDGAFQKYVAKLNALARQESTIELMGVVIPPHGAMGHTRYVHRVKFFPAPGKEIELQGMLEEFVLARQEKEDRPAIRLLQQRFSPGGQVFVVNDNYKNLTEYENIINKLPDSIRLILARSSAFAHQPTTHELSELLIPFPD